MLKILIKARVLALLDSLSQVGKGKNKGKSVYSMGLIVGGLALLLMGSVGYMFWGYCQAFAMIGSAWGFWVIAVIYAAMMCIIGSIFTVKTQIFESRDNELLLSMPIPVKYIFASRMIVLLIVNYALQSVVLLPCLVVYAILCGLSFGGAMCYVGVFMLLPFLMVAVSTAVGWIISEISARVKHKTAVTVVLFLIFFGAYMYFSVTLSSLLGSDGALYDPSGLQNTLVFWWGADAIANGNALSLLWLALSSIIPAVIVLVILNKTFLRLITTKKSAAKVEYKGNKSKGANVSVALLKKELLRFGTSANYLLNSGIGYVMTVVAAIALAVSAPDIKPLFEVEGLEWLFDLVPVAIVAICSLTCSMSSGSAPAISLEDRQMWILKTCPIEPRSILMAKLNAFILVSAPFAVVGATVLCIAYGVGAWMSLFVIVTTFACVVLGNYVGLFFGLKFPKFGWQNENAVIKQSAAVTVTMLGMMALSVGFGTLGYFTSKVSPWLAVFAVFAVALIISAIIHVYLVGYGAKEYENLKK